MCQRCEYEIGTVWHGNQVVCHECSWSATTEDRLTAGLALLAHIEKESHKKTIERNWADAQKDNAT